MTYKTPAFIQSACGLFTRHRESIEKLREAGNLKHLYRNELGYDFFTYDSKDEILDMMDIKEDYNCCLQVS